MQVFQQTQWKCVSISLLSWWRRLIKTLFSTRFWPLGYLIQSVHRFSLWAQFYLVDVQLHPMKTNKLETLLSQYWIQPLRYILYYYQMLVSSLAKFSCVLFGKRQDRHKDGLDREGWAGELVRYIISCSSAYRPWCRSLGCFILSAQDDNFIKKTNRCGLVQLHTCLLSSGAYEKTR